MITVVFIAGHRRHGVHLLADHRRRAQEPRRTGRAIGTGRADRPVTPDEFRASGHDLIDWIADYIDTRRGAARCSRRSSPATSGAALPAHPPTDARAVRRRDGRPRPRHRARAHPLAAPELLRLLPVEHSYPSILGELLTAGLGVQGMSWVTSPACTELETLMLDWMVELLGLPDRFRSTSEHGGGVIQGSASEAVLVAILAARWRATGGAINADGDTSTARRLRHVAGALEHREGPAHRRHRHRPHPHRAARRDVRDAARRARRDDRRRPRRRPACRSSCAPPAARPRRWRSTRPPRSGPSAEREHVWLHVDAAMSGIAALVPEFRWVNDGLDLVDSYCTNPHKWMGVNFDCNLFWTADRAVVARRAEHPARVPALGRRRTGRGDRLPRLADPARPPDAGPQAVVRDPLRRRRVVPDDDPPPRRADPGARRLGRRRRPLRDRRPAPAEPAVPRRARRQRRDRRR